MLSLVCLQKRRQLMNRAEVQKCLEEHYPGFEVSGRKTVLCRNSSIYMLDLCRGQIQKRIVVKISRNYQPREVAIEYANLSRFYNGCKGGYISSPKPLFVNAEKGILGMSYVQGTNFSLMLHEVRPASLQCISSAASLSGIALARYHEIFSRSEGDHGDNLKIDAHAREDDINQFLSESREHMAECNLWTHVTPFFDFTTWNILVSVDPSNNLRLFLIDFPRLDYVCTPHLDLARFRFGLELIKQFPPSKFFGLNRWDVDALYDQFLGSYCREMNVSLNDDDLWLIARARKAYIRRAQDLTRKGPCGWQPKLEQMYLRTFSRDWLDQGDVFSKWPGMGLAEREQA
jgi:hypothetical protein